MYTTFGRGVMDVGTQRFPSLAQTPLAGHAAPPAHTPSTTGQQGPFPARWFAE
jgi:hypothetical protein